MPVLADKVPYPYISSEDFKDLVFNNIMNNTYRKLNNNISNGFERVRRALSYIDFSGTDPDVRDKVPQIINGFTEIINNTPDYDDKMVKEKANEVSRFVGQIREFIPASSQKWIREIESAIHSVNRIVDSRIREKIEDLHIRMYHQPILKDRDIIPIMAVGMPGNGKTTVMEIAAKEFAQAIGLNFVYRPAPPYTPEEKDFVFSVIDLGGEMSNLTLGGIPTTDKIDNGDKEMKFMSKIPLYNYKVLGDALVGMALHDDIGNASVTVQNGLLYLISTGNYQGVDIGNSVVAFTANLGSLDGTYTNAFSNAFLGRMNVFYVEDDLNDFVKRINKKFKDDKTGIYDGGVISFLLLNPDLFQLPTDSKEVQKVNGNRPQSPSPRNFDRLISTFRETVFLGKDKDYQYLNSIFSSCVGPYVGAKLAAHIYDMRTGAQPLASELIREGKVSEELEKKLGNGVSSESQAFAYQFAMALVMEAVAAIRNDPSNLSLYANRMADGLLRTNNEYIITAMSDFRRRMENVKPDFFEKGSRIPIMKGEAIAIFLQAFVDQLPKYGLSFSKEKPEEEGSQIVHAISGVLSGHALLRGEAVVQISPKPGTKQKNQNQNP